MQIEPSVRVALAGGAVPGRQTRLSGVNTAGSAGVAPHNPRPWWLWPHLLSLDAPLVALVWQDWWGRVNETPPSISQRAILGLGVWMIYLADHLADTRRNLPDESLTARHAFAQIRRLPLVVLTAVIAASLVLLAPWALRTREFLAGLGLLATAAGYFWLIHRRGSQGWTVFVPKEAVVGGMFAVGTAFFVFCRATVPPGSLLLSVALFGVTCFLNCALITSWERNPCDRRDPFSFLNAFPWLAARGLRWACWSLAAIAGGAAWASGTAVFLPVALAVALLGLLDRWQRRLPSDVVRSLADAVLLTPWVCEAAFAMLRVTCFDVRFQLPNETTSSFPLYLDSPCCSRSLLIIGGAFIARTECRRGTAGRHRLDRRAPDRRHWHATGGKFLHRVRARRDHRGRQAG